MTTESGLRPELRPNSATLGDGCPEPVVERYPQPVHEVVDYVHRESSVDG